MENKVIKTVGDLITELQKKDPNTEIFLYNGEFMYGKRMVSSEISAAQVYDESHYGGVRVKESWDTQDDLAGKNVRDAIILGYEIW